MSKTVQNNDFINNLCKTFDKNNKITPDSYNLYNIKRGLRNKDGTGVIAGISCIADVHGYNVLDGVKVPDKGVLTYRGIDITDVVNHIDEEERFGFEEICYLLLVGSLPNKNELEEFTSLMGHERKLPKYFMEDMIMRAPSNNIMNKLASCTLALYSYDEKAEDRSIENVLSQGISVVSKIPTIMSYAYQAKRRYYDQKSMHLHIPSKNLSTSENILRLIRNDKKYTAEEAKLLDKILIVHAEHGGGTNSAFTTRVLSSTDTDTYSAVAASIGSLKGYRHGGASFKVADMLDNIMRNVSNWEDEGEVLNYLEKMVKKEVYDESGLIYGMGHAIYTLSDPRAEIIRENAGKLAHNTRYAEEFELIRLVEKLAPVAFENIKTKKVMCANVDMYSGFVYRMLGIPAELYTPIFAVARSVGWIAHRMEEVTYGNKIIRPAYKTIYSNAEFTPLLERE